MHSVDLLAEALLLAERSGFDVRREWLGESLGGACRIGSKWVLFVNLTLPTDEQLIQVIEALRESDIVKLDPAVSSPLSQLLDRGRASGG